VDYIREGLDVVGAIGAIGVFFKSINIFQKGWSVLQTTKSCLSAAKTTSVAKEASILAKEASILAKETSIIKQEVQLTGTMLAEESSLMKNRITKEADFVVGPNGIAIPKSRAVLESGFQNAGFQTFEVRSKGMGYILPNGTKVRIMEAAGKAPLRASFTNFNDGPISLFTLTPPQPPRGLDVVLRKEFVRKNTHLELGP
ncbi:hypothetical protein, partial [Parachlamydia acanthamoebae]